jgi:hypothetical protein
MKYRPKHNRRWQVALSGALVFSAIASIVHADTLHDIGAGSFQHHDSGWIFPRQIGEFVRIGAPQDVDGTIDVVAYYAREAQDGRTTASIDVYPKNSAVSQASYDDSVTALATESHAAATSALAKSEIRIDGALPLTAIEVHSETQSALYFVDTGHWIIKVRVRNERTNVAALASIEAFVRQQRWDSLSLTQQTCTGPACAPAASGAHTSP